MSKQVKEMVMDELRSRLNGARDLLVVDVSRMDALSTNKLRLSLRQKQISMLTIRNSLAKRVLDDAGAALEPVLEGPSTLVWGGQDVVALSKEIAAWADKIEHFNIKGGVVEGGGLDSEGVKRLSKSPSREELLSKIAGAILGPGSQLAAALLGPGAMLASQIKSLAEKEGEGAEASSE
jgi:large subunit ribosomal protein L10